MKYTKCWIVLVAGLLALEPFLSAKAPAQAKTEQDRLHNAGKVMHEILNVPDDIPQDLLNPNLGWRDLLGLPQPDLHMKDLEIVLRATIRIELQAIGRQRHARTHY